MIYDTNSYVINNYNFLVANKSHVKTIKFSKKAYNLVKVLYKTGAINNFVVTKINKKAHKNIKNNLYIRFTIFLFKRYSFYKNIRLISTKTKKFFISLKTLRLISTVFKNSLLIISTSVGLLTHHQAIKLAKGGLILCILT